MTNEASKIGKPKLASLTEGEKEELIKHIDGSSLSKEDKASVIELVKFCDALIEKLKLSNISINKLKEMLLGFKPDKLKKLLQTRQ